MKSKINKKMSLAELIEKNPKAAEILLDKGIHCIGCPFAKIETLEEGAIAHGIDVDELIKELNEKLNEK